MKGFNSGIAIGKTFIGSGVGKGHRASGSFQIHHSQHFHVFSNPKAFQTPSFQVFMEALLYRLD